MRKKEKMNRGMDMNAIDVGSSSKRSPEILPLTRPIIAPTYLEAKLYISVNLSLAASLQALIMESENVGSAEPRIYRGGILLREALSLSGRGILE
jgi:hypothetical protein